MICPRCTVAEIAESGHCVLCGFSPAAGVILQESVINEVKQVVQQATADRFRIQALLRLGERSLVYLAYEMAHERLVALKVIPVREGVRQALANRFERQAALYQALRQAHIVTMHAFGTAATFLWYTLEHVKGDSLGDVLRERGPLSLELCLGIADQVATALDYAHRRGVPHGNLKPSNIFLDDRWVRVGDFAILEAFGREASGAGPSRRLPEYLAPEQFYARSPLASADQYALAIIVHQCLTGTLPFIGDSFEEVARRQARDAPPSMADIRKDLPVPMSEAVSRALSKQPAGRFPSVLDFVTALGAAQAPAPVPRRSAPARRPTPTRGAAATIPVLLVEPETPPRRRWKLVLLALAVVGGGTVYTLRDRFPPPPLAEPPFARQGDPLPAAVRPSLPATGTAPEVARAPGEPPATSATSSAGPSAAAVPAAPAPTPVARPATATAQPGTLLVNATPWGQLFIDGVFIGNTPKVNIPVSAGRHRIRIAREGYEPFERELLVEPGQVIRLTGIVLRPRGS